MYVFISTCFLELHVKYDNFLSLGRKTSANTGKELTCVWCRAPWAVHGPAASAAGVKRAAGGYINLAGAAGLSPVRDTSTCTSSFFRDFLCLRSCVSYLRSRLPWP